MRLDKFGNLKNKIGSYVTIYSDFIWIQFSVYFIFELAEFIMYMSKVSKSCLKFKQWPKVKWLRLIDLKYIYG